MYASTAKASSAPRQTGTTTQRSHQYGRSAARAADATVL